MPWLFCGFCVVVLHLYGGDQDISFSSGRRATSWRALPSFKANHNIKFDDKIKDMPVRTLFSLVPMVLSVGSCSWLYLGEEDRCSDTT